MIFKTAFMAEAQPKAVFAAFHQYKISQNPARFFPTRLARWHFEVLTEHALGEGAIYEWKISLLGLPILAFKEQIVEWEDGRLVVYKAISGWKMVFRVNLEHAADCTLTDITIDFSLGGKVLDRLLRPFVEWGLGRVCRNGLQKEGIQTRTVGRGYAMNRAG